MAERIEIEEYPYKGVIKRDGLNSLGKKETLVIYEGVMDEHMTTDDEGRLLQTSSYIITIPLIKDESGKYIIPKKGDVITLERYGEELEFTIDNAEPSQLGGISIYSTKKDWQ